MNLEEPGMDLGEADEKTMNTEKIHVIMAVSEHMKLAFKMMVDEGSIQGLWLKEKSFE